MKKFNELYNLILEELTSNQKELVDRYTNKRLSNLSFGPIFKEERTYFSIDSSNLNVLVTPTNILEILDQENYYCPDYRQGYVYKKEDKLKSKPVKLIKVLSKLVKNETKFNQLKKEFDERLKTSRKENIKCLICITHNPYDVAGMSTDRSWTSCMNLDDGRYKDTALKQVQYGGMCAYLIKENDKNIEEPIARVAIKRLIAGDSLYNFIFLSEERIYGDKDFANELNFNQIVNEQLQKSNELTSKDSYKFFREDENSYSDKNLQQYIKLSVIDKIADKLNINDWEHISKQSNLSEDFIRKYQDKLNWDNISKYSQLSMSFIKEFQNKLNWEIFSERIPLTDEYIKTFKNKIDWDVISERTLSEDFMRKYQNYINWEYIGARQELSEDFIREFQDKLDWYDISYDQKLSENFIREFQNKVNWDWIFAKQQLSDAFKEEFKDKQK